LIQIVYASAAREPFTPLALNNLLVKSRARNLRHKVTGMLLYHSGSFLQVLEGAADDVDLIMASIVRDPRHHRIKVLVRREIEFREFEAWSMGYIDTSSWPAKPGLVDYHRVLQQLSGVPSIAHRYLRLFQQGLCRQANAA
jgi:hypothetical protein